MDSNNFSDCGSGSSSESAKEMQRAELEESTQKRANSTALQAIGPRKKPRLEGPGGDSSFGASSHGSGGLVGTAKNPEVPKQVDDSDTPLLKRKRKLYSPKDDHVINEKTGAHVSETEEDTILPAESFDLALKDHLENIIEKLDTTLDEIRHETSTKLDSMFVDSENYLNELKEQRDQMLKETAAEVMSAVVKVMNDKFESFDRRSQEIEEQFKASFKEKARNLVHEDWKQKRLMMTLLKQDVQQVDMKKGQKKDVKDA